MARKTRPDRCRSCGDVAQLDPETFKPTGYCAACAAPAPKAAAKARRVARLADRDVVVTRTPITCPTCGNSMSAAYAKKGYQCDSCADAQEQGEDMEWRREIAMEAGMGLGIQAYNEHMGNA